jgi:hypothetical protein
MRARGRRPCRPRAWHIAGGAPSRKAPVDLGPHFGGIVVVGSVDLPSRAGLALSLRGAPVKHGPMCLPQPRIGSQCTVIATCPAGRAGALTRPVSGHGTSNSTPTSTCGTSSQYSMITRQPREIPPAWRHAHTSSLSSRHSIGNSCHVVIASTTAVSGEPRRPSSSPDSSCFLLSRHPVFLAKDAPLISVTV